MAVFYNVIKLDSLVTSTIPTITLIYMLRQSEEQDKRHNKTIKRMDGQIDIMENQLKVVTGIEKKNVMQNIISASASAAYSDRTGSLEHGIRMFISRSCGYGCLTKWDLFYGEGASSYKRQNFYKNIIEGSYMFRVRVILIPIKYVDRYKHLGNCYFIPNVYFNLIKMGAIAAYEIQISRHKGDYGIFSEHNNHLSIANMDNDEYGAVCNAVGCIQFVPQLGSPVYPK